MIDFRRFSFVAVFALAACSANTLVPERSGVPSTVRRAASKGPIKHVIFIVQENRSFNNIFMGYPRATTQNYGYDTHGRKIALHAQSFKEGWDISHNAPSYFQACDGQGSLPGTDCKNDGWNLLNGGFKAPKNFAYAYLPRQEVDVYWKMAQQYVLADDMFASNLDGSFIAHQYIVAAYASQAVNSPFSLWGCEGGKPDKIQTLTAQRSYGQYIPACFDNPTIGSEADSARISWRFYSGSITGDGGLWSSYQADSQIFNGPDWKSDVINPPSQFLTDIGNGQLADVTWITPTYETSDHAGEDSTLGPPWVASLVDAVGASKFWNSSAIFLIWDDWGGWFDPVKPVFEDYDGLGYRIPLIIISPYAKKGRVTHVQYETASVLRFMEDDFSLPPMAAADARANDPAADPAAFDYSQKPRVFQKFKGSRSSAFWAARERAARLHPIQTRFIGDD